jgi:iron-sulfur cluster insertion protein
MNVNISDAAIVAFKENLKLDNSENKYIRIAINGGGCSGYKYALDIVDLPDEDDTVWEKDSVKFVVDPYSVSYLEGVSLDYTSGLNGSGFKFDNPAAKKTCGCGSSFSV